MTKGFVFGALAVLAFIGAGCTEPLIGDVLVEKQATAGGVFYDVQYRCRGEQKSAEVAGAPVAQAVFCVGDAQLAVLDDSGDVIATWKTSTSEDKEAPVLGEITSLGDDRLLVFFGKDECSTVGNCGVGMTYPAGTHVIDIPDNKVDVLENMPSGVPTWNMDETKAVIVPETCGGGGCGTAALVAYNIEKDEQETVTEEQGANEVNAQDAQGNKAAYWQSVTWKDNNTIEAVLLMPDGSEERIEVDF